MTMRTGSIRRVCHCGAEIRVSPSAVAQGKGKACSVPCSQQIKRAPARVPVRAKPQPTSITPKYLDRLPAIDNGSHVACARCERIRERGARCVCERWTPDGAAS
jgi:hypothetical protein